MYPWLLLTVRLQRRHQLLLLEKDPYFVNTKTCWLLEMASWMKSMRRCGIWNGKKKISYTIKPLL